MAKTVLTAEQIAAFEEEEVPQKKMKFIGGAVMTAPQVESCKEQTHTIENDALIAQSKPVGFPSDDPEIIAFIKKAIESKDKQLLKIASDKAMINASRANVDAMTIELGLWLAQNSRSKPDPKKPKPQPKTPDQPAPPKKPTVPPLAPNKVPGPKPAVTPVKVVTALYVREEGGYRPATQEEINTRATGHVINQQFGPPVNGEIKRNPVEVSKPELLFDGTDLAQSRFDKDQLMVLNKQELCDLANSLKIRYRTLGMNASSLRHDICKAIGWSTEQRPVILKEEK